MIEAIFFDFDGVIVESCDIKTEAFARLFENETEEDLRRIVDYHLANAGVSRFEKFKYIYAAILKKPLGRAEFNRLCGGFAKLVKEAVIAAPYVKGAIEFLVRNASRYKYFLLSATPKEELAEILSRRGIERLFSRIYGAPDKKADVIKNVLLRERLAPRDALYVGDAASDYAAARQNGVRFIARASKKISAFKDVDCIKILDLTHLEEGIGRI